MSGMKKSVSYAWSGWDQMCNFIILQVHLCVFFFSVKSIIWSSHWINNPHAQTLPSHETKNGYLSDTLRFSFSSFFFPRLELSLEPFYFGLPQTETRLFGHCQLLYCERCIIITERRKNIQAHPKRNPLETLHLQSFSCIITWTALITSIKKRKEITKALILLTVQIFCLELLWFIQTPFKRLKLWTMSAY